ncbi:MAG: HD domain-containing protein [Chloroflexi bacterium]|nr:MAG: HD domain-containing protein [Chloroflexota bacterium]
MSKNGRLRRILILSGASLATALALSLIAMVASATTAIIALVLIMWLSVWRIVGNNRKEAASLKAQLEASRSNTDAIIERLCAALGMRDTVRDRELERLSRLASILVRQMRVPTEQAALVDQAAALRDIGKRGVAESVLLKEEDFTEHDWREMKRHPEIGYRMLSEVSFLRELAEVVRCHHERYDGQGYPRGVSGEKIPIAARILSVLDAYVAMTSERPYRKTRTHEDAMQEVLRHAGTQFDPVVVRALAEAERRGLFGEGRENGSPLGGKDARVASGV